MPGMSGPTVKEEDESVARRYHFTLLSGNLRQAFLWATNRGREGASSQEELRVGITILSD